jgi:hypothetical protein
MVSSNPDNIRKGTTALPLNTSCAFSSAIIRKSPKLSRAVSQRYWLSSTNAGLIERGLDGNDTRRDARSPRRPILTARESFGDFGMVAFQ